MKILNDSRTYGPLLATQNNVITLIEYFNSISIKNAFYNPIYCHARHSNTISKVLTSTLLTQVLYRMHCV